MKKSAFFPSFCVAALVLVFISLWPYVLPGVSSTNNFCALAYGAESEVPMPGENSENKEFAGILKDAQSIYAMMEKAYIGLSVVSVILKSILTPEEYRAQYELFAKLLGQLEEMKQIAVECWFLIQIDAVPTDKNLASLEAFSEKAAEFNQILHACLGCVKQLQANNAPTPKEGVILIFPRQTDSQL